MAKINIATQTAILYIGAMGCVALRNVFTFYLWQDQQLRVYINIINLHRSVDNSNGENSTNEEPNLSDQHTESYDPEYVKLH